MSPFAEKNSPKTRLTDGNRKASNAENGDTVESICTDAVHRNWFARARSEPSNWDTLHIGWA